MKKTILVGGCSHSAVHLDYVKDYQTWPMILREKYNCNLIRQTIPGAGNTFIIDHLMWELNKNKVDLVIFQITEQYRTTLGINHLDLLGKDHLDFHGATCKSLNIFFNADFWEKYSTTMYKLEPDRHNFDDRKHLFLEKYPSYRWDIVYDPIQYEMFDTFYLEQILPSAYETQVRHLKELYTLQCECELKNIPILFIEWWKPLLNLDIEGVKFYYNKLDRDKFIEFDFDKNWDVRKFKVPAERSRRKQYFGEDSTHFNEKGHKMFFEKYIKSNLPIKLDAKI